MTRERYYTVNIHKQLYDCTCTCTYNVLYMYILDYISVMYVMNAKFLCYICNIITMWH